MIRSRTLLLLALLACTGCVQRVLNVQTDPSGATVYLNDREVGRTPFRKIFLWYGNYDVVVRKDGYQTLKTNAVVTAPFWQFVPFDLVTDFLPLTDNEKLNFTLKPDVPSDPVALMQRGEQMSDLLESTSHTIRKNVLDVHPTSRPATAPVDQP